MDRRRNPPPRRKRDADRPLNRHRPPRGRRAPTRPHSQPPKLTQERQLAQPSQSAPAQPPVAPTPGVLRFTRTAKIMCAVEAALFAALLAAGLLISAILYPFERPLAFAAGLSTGCVLSLLKILLLDRTLARAVDMGPSAKGYANLHALLRYAGTVAALAPAVLFPAVFGLVGVIAGVLSLQVAAYITSGLLGKPTATVVPHTTNAKPRHN